MFERALAVTEANPLAQNNLGAALGKAGHTQEAIEHFEEALRLQPSFVPAHNNMAFLLARTGHPLDAIPHFQATLRFQPGHPEIDYNLGLALLQTGQLDEALLHFQKAVELRPDDTEARNRLARILFRKGQAREAIAQLERILELQPDNTAVCNNLALVLATSPEASVRNGARAVELARRAEQLSGGKDPLMITTLAAAYAEAGQFPEAVRAAQRALELAAVQNNTALVNSLRAQIGAYQEGSPVRDASSTNASSYQDRP